jgi:replicative DNA helicase
MAMKYQIPIVICSQLNRESQDKKPTMKDIKETGDIEQDADIIILMDRNTNPDELVSREYKFKKNGRLHECDLDIETVLIVCKNRNGKTRNTYLNHDMSCMRFSEHEDTKQPQIPNF